MSIKTNKYELFNHKATIIDELGNNYLVREIIENGNDFFSKIPSRSLVLLLCQNNYESVFCYINCINRGIVPILIDSKSDFSLINSLINIYLPSYIFNFSSNKINVKNYLNKNFYNGYDFLARKNHEPIVINSKLSLLLSTSGTTGSPKLVRLSYNNLVSNASSIAQYLNLDKNEIAISSLPMNYSFGLSIINSHLFAGGSILMTNESITQRRFWNLFKKYKVTSLSGVPYSFNILKNFRLLNIDLPSLKTITQAGGKLSNELIDYFAKFSLTKNVKFYVMYGQTEGTARLSYLNPKFVFEKLGSIGMPIPNGNFYIINDKGIRIEKPEVKGELVYEGSNVMLGYSQFREELTKGDENKGCLKTGDIAYFDSDGFYYIVGRTKRFIKLFGNRINLDEVEKLLFQIDIDSACVGKDNLLFVYILKEIKFDQVKTFLNKKLGLHLSVINIRVVDEIPKNLSGKKLYSKLSVEL